MHFRSMPKDEALAFVESLRKPVTKHTRVIKGKPRPTVKPASKTKNLENLDSLALMIEDVKSFPLLTDEQELTLTRLAAQGDPIAKNKLVLHNLRMVVQHANRVHKAAGEKGLPLQDLIQEGVLGLIRSIEKFDPDRGYKFSTYALWWIRQSIGKGLGDKSRVIRVPSHIITIMHQIRVATDTLYNTLGREPTQEEIAARVGISVEKMIDITQHASPTISLSAKGFPSGDDEYKTDPELYEVTVDTTAPSTHEQATQGLAAEILHEQLKTLNHRERRILELRYGLGGEAPLTLAELADIFGIAQHRVRVIEMNALEKLRNNTDLQLLREDLE